MMNCPLNSSENPVFPKLASRWFCEFMGAPPQPAKCFVPACNRHYLGTSVHVGDALTLGVVRFQPKSATQWKVLSRLQQAIDTQSLDRDTSGKLRGDLNWMWSMCAGHIGRIAGPLLSAKQTSDSPHLDRTQLFTLQLLMDVVRHAPPRDIVVQAPSSQLSRLTPTRALKMVS